METGTMGMGQVATAPLNTPAVVCPMEYCLPLLPPAAKVARPAVVNDLGNMSPYRPPSSDLAFVVRTPSPHVVPAVPLKPSPRVLVINPPPLPPLGERQRGIYTEQVQSGIMPLTTHPGFSEPRRREFLNTISHVLAAEDAQLEHLFRSEIRVEAGVEILPHRFREDIGVVMLHQVIDDHPSLFHNHLRHREPT